MCVLVGVGVGSEVMVEIFKGNATDKAASVDNINKRILYNYFETQLALAINVHPQRWV